MESQGPALRSPIRRWLPVIIALVVAVVAAGVLVVTSGESDDAVVVYNGRSHYGGEEAFAAFTRETGIKVKLFGGDAQSLHDRLEGEGANTKADLLITVDGANLWRAKNAGFLLAANSTVIDDAIPATLRDADHMWTALSTRVRTPMRSTKVAADAVPTYESLGDPKWKGKLCLRTSTSIYNLSLVADFIAKRGEAATEALLRSWMANKPKILGNDVEVLNAINRGRCDVGLANHYYLARQLLKNSSYRVAPAFPTAEPAGVHANLSGAGVVKYTDRKADAVKLLEFLVQREAQEAFAEQGEFPANPDVEPIEVVAEWRDVKLDPINSEAAGKDGKAAVRLMRKVGWN
ncbi:MAG: extracellular solute-binding protein [Acidimicrobiales bacterium]|nr:extracellular solute-binding protein [Acidimicrobiales bacterium]